MRLPFLYQLALLCALSACDPALRLITSAPGDAGIGDAGSDDAPAAQPPPATIVRSFGGAEVDKGHAAAFAANGDLLVCGQVQGIVDFGAGVTLSGPGTYDAFVARFDGSGRALWARGFSGGGGSIAEVVVELESGRLVVGGTFIADLDVGTTHLTGVGGWDGFVAQLEADGAPLRATAITGSYVFGGVESLSAVGEEVLVAGALGGTGTVAGDPRSFTDGELFVARLGSDLLLHWITSFPFTALANLGALAVDERGESLLAGLFSGEITMLGETQTSRGGHDIFAARLDATGQVSWAKAYGSIYSDTAHGAILRPSGEALVAGGFSGTVDFGGTSLTSQGEMDGLVLRLDAEGETLSATSFGGAGSEQLLGCSINQSGVARCVGTVTSPVLGLAPSIVSGAGACLVLEIDAVGELASLHRFGEASGCALGRHIGQSASRLALTGSFSERAVIEGQELSSAGEDDGLLVVFDPQ